MGPAFSVALVVAFTIGIYYFAKRGTKPPAGAALEHLALGNTIRAEMLMNGAVKASANKRGADHPVTATLRMQLGMIQARSGDPEGALESFREGAKVPPGDDTETDKRKPAVEAYGQLLAELAIRAFKSRKSKQAKELLQEAVGVIEQNSPLHGFVTAQLGAVNAGRMPDFAAREKAIGAALKAHIDNTLGTDALVSGVNVNLGAGSFNAEPVLSREPSPEEANAVSQALRAAFAEVEKNGVDAFLGA